MMKKIKSIYQLKAEKKRIKLQQAELEDDMKRNWTELKGSLRPVNVAQDFLNSVINKKREDDLKKDGILKNMFNYGLTMLVNKISERANEKFRNYFKK